MWKYNKFMKLHKEIYILSVLLTVMKKCVVNKIKLWNFGNTKTNYSSKTKDTNVIPIYGIKISWKSL
jgi:hypothetical protein